MSIDDESRKRIVRSIRAYIARERISREEFASRTKLGKSTVDKLVTGLFSEKTIQQIEAALGVRLLDSASASLELAAEQYGKYSRDDTHSYIGQYVFARPSFRVGGRIHAFHMEIVWDSAEKVLVIQESEASRKAAAQFGKIYIPRASMHIFVLSNEKGWLKQVILSQLDIHRRMKGMMLTMGNAFANVYSPVGLPVIMNKYEKIEASMLGELDPSSSMYEEYNQDLLAVEQDQYGKWIGLAQI